MVNKEIAKIFREITNLLDIKGDSTFRIRAYNKAADVLDKMPEDISRVKTKIPGIGPGLKEKIDEYIKKGKIKYYEELKKETAIRQIVTYYFKSKGLGLEELKQNAKKRKIIYSRFTKPAKQLLELAGSVEKSEKAIKTVAEWAQSRKLDYAIETVFKKWLEIGQLKPKEIIKKPYYRGRPMVWSQTKKKWYVISNDGDWLEYGDKENQIEWKIQE